MRGRNKPTDGETLRFKDYNLLNASSETGVWISCWEKRHNCAQLKRSEESASVCTAVVEN